MNYHSPKKSLGQNFLTSVPARIAIIEAGELTASDTVLEIGPGKGFLTKGLLESGAHVVGLEKDRELIPVLSDTFAPEIANKQLTLIEGDALEFDPSTFHFPLSTFKLIANIPYYITGAILSNSEKPLSSFSAKELQAISNSKTEPNNRSIA
jgi:16S rRNA (adenine1518-N6/adenine1519-N6)-dimethyltransferase